MICFLNASDYPAGANDNTSSLYRVTDTSSSSSDSPDSPVSIVSSSSSSNLSTSPRPSTPAASRQTFDGWKRFVVSDSCSGKNVLHHLESPSGQVFLSAEEAEKYLHSFNGLTVELNFDGLETHFLADNDCSNTSVPYTFCDMPPNIVDMKRRKARKPSREFNKRRRKSTTSNFSSIKSRRSTNSSSTSIDDDFDDVSVTSPLTLELQELLSEVIKSVADRLDRVDEDDEQEDVEINLQNVDKSSQNVAKSSQNVAKSSQIVEVSAQNTNRPCQNINKSSHNVDSQVKNIPVVDVKRHSVEDRVPNVENAAHNIDTDPSKPESTQTTNHVLPEKPFASSEIAIRHSRVDTQISLIVENNVSSTKNLTQFDISEHSPEQKTELSGNLQQTASEASNLPGPDPIISLDCQAMFLNTRISKRRSTIDTCLMQQDNPERRRRLSAEPSIALAPILNQAPFVEEPPVDAQTSTPAEDEKLVAEILAPKMSVEKFYSTALPKKRPGSLDLSPRLESKRKRLSGSLTPDPDHAGSKVPDFIRSSTDRPISADALESPQELFPPPAPCNSQEHTNDQKEVVSLSCDDFEDEIAACNDFEEVELDIVEVFSNNGDPDQLDERDPLALSDKDISSPLPTITPDISTKDCRIDMVDMFYQTPLESHFCCGCSKPYSQADMFSFNLKVNTMTRICGFCFWWTSRHVGAKTKKL